MSFIGIGLCLIIGIITLIIGKIINKKWLMIFSIIPLGISIIQIIIMLSI